MALISTVFCDKQWAITTFPAGMFWITEPSPSMVKKSNITQMCFISNKLFDITVLVYIYDWLSHRSPLFRTFWFPWKSTNLLKFLRSVGYKENINKRVKMWHTVFHFKDLIWNCENFIAEQFLFFEDESIITLYFWAATWSRIW